MKFILFYAKIQLPMLTLVFLNHHIKTRAVEVGLQETIICIQDIVLFSLKKKREDELIFEKLISIQKFKQNEITR